MTDYSELSDFEINGLIAKHTQKVGDFTQARGLTFIHDYVKPVDDFGSLCLGWKEFDPCNSPADAWPIISVNGISLIKCTVGSGYWSAETITDIDEVTDKIFNCQSSFDYQDANPLRAAMIVFLMMQDASHG